LFLSPNMNTALSVNSILLDAMTPEHAEGKH